MMLQHAKSSLNFIFQVDIHDVTEHKLD